MPSSATTSFATLPALAGGREPGDESAKNSAADEPLHDAQNETHEIHAGESEHVGLQKQKVERLKFLRRENKMPKVFTDERKGTDDPKHHRPVEFAVAHTNEVMNEIERILSHESVTEEPKKVIRLV